jgi:succinate dehydrogenase/fumarate reductase-like Fe-S protein
MTAPRPGERIVVLTLVRFDPAVDASPWEERFEVPVDDDTTLLDAVQWVREHVDSSVAVRFACRSANACKECIAEVDGRPLYLCTTRAENDAQLAPVHGRRVIRDLVVQL